MEVDKQHNDRDETTNDEAAKSHVKQEKAESVTRKEDAEGWLLSPHICLVSVYPHP